jgi:hypothetical protein
VATPAGQSGVAEQPTGAADLENASQAGLEA